MRLRSICTKKTNRTYVYIDGFNLYYGALKRTKYKWLDVKKMCITLLPSPEYDLQHIRYFTAPVKSPPNDPLQHVRQEAYFRALKTISNLEIHFGSFLENKVKLPDATNPINPDGSWNTHEVRRSEEKGSDVNLATYLLVDGFRNRYDTAVVISNDSDFIEPIKVIKTELKKNVEVFSPYRRTSTKLRGIADKCQVIWRSTIRNCQFPPAMNDATGPFHKPPEW